LGIGSQPPLPSSVPTYFFFGLILLVTGTYLSFVQPGIDFLTLAMAAAFFVMSAVTYKRFRNSCPTC
jgi:ABC-type multidrug transport system permease subunit